VKTKFDPIIKAIVKMIQLLQKEEEQDLSIKQRCEEDRMGDTREAIVKSRDIDDMTDGIAKLTAHIADAAKQIEEIEAELAKTHAELESAEAMRDRENTAWRATDADDKAAAETVESAKDVLSGFYKDNALVFVQKQPVSGMAGGDAPPPPPPTWEGGYGGKTGESQGIVAIMEMVYEDIVKDRGDAKADEEASEDEFQGFKSDAKEKIKFLNEERKNTEKAMGDAETERIQTAKQRATQKGLLNVVLEKIASIDPNCEYYEVNYPMRTSNRQIEIDGLNKATAILKGGVFDEAPDPDREMTVGDAASAVFLQRSK